MSEVTELDKTTFEKLELNQTPKFLTDSAGQRGLPKMPIENCVFNFSLYFFEPKSINSFLSGFNLSLLVDVHFFVSSMYLFNCSKEADVFSWDKCT